MTSCAVCLESCSSRNSATIDNSSVCHCCTTYIFELAIRSEDYYPPRWGPHTLNIDNFYWMPEATRLAFQLKEKEYLTAPAERIYCQGCNTFLAKNTDYCRTQAACPRCGMSEYYICGELYDPMFPDTCMVALGSSEHGAFDGLVLGKDYQVCPSTACGRKLQLSDGCNHILCQCGMSLCYICGQAVDENEHYMPKEEGGCPRYHHPDSPSAIWSGWTRQNCEADLLSPNEYATVAPANNERVLATRGTLPEAGTAHAGWFCQYISRHDPVRHYPFARSMDIDAFAHMPLDLPSLPLPLVLAMPPRERSSPRSSARSTCSQLIRPTDHEVIRMTPTLYVMFPQIVRATAASEQTMQGQYDSSGALSLAQEEQDDGSEPLLLV